jgi:GMP synthase-like glutamine amidotransferase
MTLAFRAALAARTRLFVAKRSASGNARPSKRRPEVVSRQVGVEGSEVAVRVLFVQQDHVSPTGPVGEAFADHGFDVEEFLVVPEDSFHDPSVLVDFPDPTGYDVIVPMGAPWSIYDHDTIGTWVHEEIDFLRGAHEAGVPVLGICFGGQALACAVGGAVIPATQPEVGWTLVETKRPDLVPPGPWFQWHGDRWVLPDGITALARTPLAEQAFVSGRSLGVQFHPELTPAMLDGWLAFGGEAHARGLGLDPDGLRAETAVQAEPAAQRARSLVRTFLENVANQPAANAS